MSPNARLTQGRFDDLDLLIADNFGRAAADAGVERIVYLGRPPSAGRAPGHLEPPRESLLEVEHALAPRRPGDGGSRGSRRRSGGLVAQLLVRLVERLPLMV